MTVSREVVRHVDHFDRAQALTTVPLGAFGWTVADTSSAGTPTYLCETADGGSLKLLLASDSEAEIVTAYQNDVLPYDLSLLQYVTFVVKVAGIDSVTTLVFGIGNARNDTADTVGVSAWFRMQGSVSTTALLAETDDGTLDLDDKAAGALAAVYKKCHIDFTNGIDDVRFFVDGVAQATGTTFDLGAITAGQNVQLMVMLQKASGTGVPSVNISKVEVQFKTADGA